MAITHTESQIVYQAGTAPWPVLPFPVQASSLSSVRVTYVFTDNTTQDLQFLVDYNVQALSFGFNVTIANAYPGNLSRVVVWRDTPRTQSTEFVDNAAFPPEAVEKALDKLTMQIQEIRNRFQNMLTVQEDEFVVNADPFVYSFPVEVHSANPQDYFLFDQTLGKMVSSDDYTVDPDAGELTVTGHDGSTLILRYTFTAMAPWTLTDDSVETRHIKNGAVTGAKIEDGTIGPEKLNFSPSSGSSSPHIIGELVLWGGPNLPDNTYLWANGEEVSRTDYPELFSVYGTTYGAGNGTTTFNLPDFRDRVPLGRGDMGGVAANRIPTTLGDSKVLGNNLGIAQHQLTVGQMPKHKHDLIYSLPAGSLVGLSGDLGSGDLWFASGGDRRSFNVSKEVADTGNNEPHPNIQPSLVTNIIIKAKL